MRPTHALITIIKVIPEVRKYRNKLNEQCNLNNRTIPADHTQVLGHVAISINEKRCLSEYHLSAGSPDLELISFNFNGSVIEVANMDDEDMHFCSEKKWNPLPCSESVTIKLKPGSSVIAIRRGQLDVRHIAFELSHVEEAR